MRVSQRLHRRAEHIRGAPRGLRQLQQRLHEQHAAARGARAPACWVRSAIRRGRMAAPGWDSAEEWASRPPLPTDQLQENTARNSQGTVAP